MKKLTIYFLLFFCFSCKTIKTSEYNDYKVAILIYIENKNKKMIDFEEDYWLVDNDIVNFTESVSINKPISCSYLLSKKEDMKLCCLDYTYREKNIKSKDLITINKILINKKKGIKFKNKDNEIIHINKVEIKYCICSAETIRITSQIKIVAPYYINYKDINSNEKRSLTKIKNDIKKYLKVNSKI